MQIISLILLLDHFLSLHSSSYSELEDYTVTLIMLQVSGTALAPVL
jgi:hypothetical protein